MAASEFDFYPCGISAGRPARGMTGGRMTAVSKFVVVIGLSILVTGCATYRPAPISPAENATALNARTLDNPRLRKFIALDLKLDGKPDPSPSWDLTKLTLAALYYHPDLDIAHAKLAAAEAGIITAGQRPNPSLNLTAAFGTSVVAGAITPGAIPATIGPVIDFVIETFGKREDRTAHAEHLADSARWDLATAGWKVRGRVRSALLTLWAAQQRMKVARQRLDLQDQLVALLERRLAVGEASSLDVARERINRAQVILTLGDLKGSAAAGRARLAAAIGIPLHALDGADFSLGAFDRPQPPAGDLAAGALRRRALTERTDVRASLADYEGAQSMVQLAVANQYPNVTLRPGYNYDFGVNKYILDPIVELPIFNQNQGPIAQAIANRQQAAADFTALQAQIIGAIDEAATSYRVAKQRLTTADALFDADQRRERQVAHSFRAGQVDRPTLITTELELTASELSQIDSTIQERQALGAVEDALQQPFFDPGRWPYVPEQNPRLANTEPSS